VSESTPASDPPPLLQADPISRMEAKAAIDFDNNPPNQEALLNSKQ
jgi:hypothetical protein